MLAGTVMDWLLEDFPTNRQLLASVKLGWEVRPHQSAFKYYKVSALCESCVYFLLFVCWGWYSALPY